MKVFSSIADFFYPNHCLHCFEKVEKKYFCENCINFFSLINPKENQFCFAAFEKKGPINTFLKEIKKNQMYGLVKLAASFIVVQINNLNWEIPDIIVPITKNRIFKDHKYYIAKEVALLLKKPVLARPTDMPADTASDWTFTKFPLWQKITPKNSKKIPS